MVEPSPEFPPPQQRSPQAALERELRQEQRIRGRVRWIASSPSGSAATLRSKESSPGLPYPGPPRYVEPPRWGFPRVAWRSPTQVPLVPMGHSALQKLRALTPFAVTTLAVFALLAVIAGGGEFWRYLLLVRSRDTALSVGEVGLSDAVVTIGSLLAFGFALLPIVVSTRWFLIARTFLETERKQVPARSIRHSIVAFVLPIFNLFAAGCVLAELEHAAFDRSPSRRPVPSRPLLVWWGLWAVNQVLLIIVVVSRLRGGLSAHTDGVFLAGLLDLSAAALAIATAFLLWQWMRAIAPSESDHFRYRRVLQVIGAPEPKLRPNRSTGIVR